MTDSQYVSIKLEPGIVRDSTKYDNKGRWYDCNWVRFRNKSPEVIGGWTTFMTDTFSGHVRWLMQMSGYSEYVGGGYRKWLIVGTDTTLYASDYADLYPIVVVAQFSSGLTNPIATTNLSPIITITDANRPTDLAAGDSVNLFVGSNVGGFTAGFLSTTWTVLDTPSPTTFRINVGSNASSTVPAGGGSVDVTYLAPVARYDYWSMDNFGFYLVANLRDSGIYVLPNNYLTVPMTFNTMLNIKDFPFGGSDQPIVSRLVCVSSEESHCIAFGCNPLGETFQDPMFIRWSDSESLSNWTPSITNTAGGYRLSVGNEIIAIQETRTEIVIWTDQSMYSMRWVGGQFVFSFTLIGNNVSIIGLNARCATNDFVAWMGNEQFYVYDGRIRELDCPISDFVFTSLNKDQLSKIYAFTNTNFSEVCWLIPTGASTEPDMMICFNYIDNLWYYGDIDRTAWLDRGAESSPVAAHVSNGNLYYQETGFDDKTGATVLSIPAFIESSPIELNTGGDGLNFMFIDRLIQDITFRDSTATEPEATMTFTMQNYPGAANATSQSTGSSVKQSVTMAVGEFTEQCWIRLRGRSLKYTCATASGKTGVTWRLGASRISLRTDGRR